MIPDVLWALASVSGVLIAYLSFDYTFKRPKRRLQKRAFDKLLGHDGGDGLPVEKSIFQRLDDQDEKLDGLTTKIDSLVAEFPKNGIPTRTALDQVASQVQAAQVREDQRWATITAALLANNIKVSVEE